MAYYHLGQQLDAVLDQTPELRWWYGPCAAGEAIRLMGEPGKALEALGEPQGPFCEDIALARIRSLLRCPHLAGRFHVQYAPQASQEISDIIARCCQEVIGLLQHIGRGRTRNEAATQFMRSLGAAFQSMELQIENPLSELGREATVADAQARKSCMDEIIGTVRSCLDQGQFPNVVRQILNRGLGYLVLRRASLIYDYCGLLVDEWARADEAGKAEETARTLGQIENYVEQVKAEAPGQPFTAQLEGPICILQKYAHPETEVDVPATLRRLIGGLVNNKCGGSRAVGFLYDLLRHVQAWLKRRERVDAMRRHRMGAIGKDQA